LKKEKEKSVSYTKSLGKPLMIEILMKKNYRRRKKNKLINNLPRRDKISSLIK
jgi:hypothetical protein